jgi:hypothetical protein
MAFRFSLEDSWDTDMRIHFPGRSVTSSYTVLIEDG